ncbi:MAG: hypothetical protein Q9195_007911 [Heterodermia aff. obscurata]
MAQASNCFLRLPLELRQHVYTTYFSSLNLTYPHLSPPPFLTSSRQLREESLHLYWQNARFNFKGTKHLVDFLFSIDQAALSNLRHISVCGFPLPLYPNSADASGYVTFSFNYVLLLFPGLQLATFEVTDPYHGDGVGEDGWGHNATYTTVESLIQSQGYKELIYTVAHDRFMKPVSFTSYGVGSPPQTETTGREPQPSTWDAMIKAKDGAESGAAVTMFRLLHDSNRRIPLKTAFETVQTETEEVADGQIEIRVKRGQGVDYMQKGADADVDEWGQRLLDMFKDSTWKEILEEDLYVDAEDDPTAHL